MRSEIAQPSDANLMFSRVPEDDGEGHRGVDGGIHPTLQGQDGDVHRDGEEEDRQPLPEARRVSSGVPEDSAVLQVHAEEGNNGGDSAGPVLRVLDVLHQRLPRHLQEGTSPADQRTVSPPTLRFFSIFKNFSMSAG